MLHVNATTDLLERARDLGCGWALGGVRRHHPKRKGLLLALVVDVRPTQEKRAKGVDINGGTQGRGAISQLWGGEAVFTHLRASLVIETTRESEVDEVRGKRSIDDDVPGSNVTMNDPTFMKGLQGLNYLLGDPNAGVKRETPPLTIQGVSWYPVIDDSPLRGVVSEEASRADPWEKGVSTMPGGDGPHAT